VASRYWPLADLRLRVGDLTLAPFTEADLSDLAALLPDDVELNPDATSYDIDARLARGTVIHQDYWRAMGTWSTAAWRLNFVVRRGTTVLGAQELEGNDFLTLRTVDTASFLVHETRGQGIGKLMRRAVLALGFGPLGAEFAISSAWPDNVASLGVSRALGYADNGRARHRRGPEGADDLVQLRLTREAWVASGLASGVEIAGVEACLPFFGLSPTK
jgi:RimJ/RimL family protein N-acetyltransferase